MIPENAHLQKNTNYEELGAIRKQIEQLNIPHSVFAGLQIKSSGFHLAETGSEKLTFHAYTNNNGHNSDKQILKWFRSHTNNNNLKFIAAGVTGKNNLQQLVSQLWLQEDIIPFILNKKFRVNNNLAEKIAIEVSSKFNTDNIVELEIGPQNEVYPAELVTLEDYKKTTSPEEFNLLQRLAQQFKGKKLIFISATPQGGGVAIMRHALIRLFRLLDVDAHWHVLQERAGLFDITKTKFHNVLQAVIDSKVKLTKQDKEIYNAAMAENAEILKNTFREADLIVIDDPQPSGLVPFIRKINPRSKIIYRSHIHMVYSLLKKPKTSQNITWNFIWNNIKSVDCFISHPIKNFIPDNVPWQKVVMMPATTDPLDGLNKPITKKQSNYYLKLFNKILIEQNQKPLDLKRPYIIQIARFDPSKGIPDVIAAYQKLREKLKGKTANPPQLVIAGNGSVDDPDGVPIYNLTMELLKGKRCAPFAEDIKVARLKPNDQLLNALLTESKIALQLSHKEGLEFKITEALMKGKPVIIYNVGGMPLQVKDGINGYIVKKGNILKVSKLLYELSTKNKQYQNLSAGALKYAGKEFLTVSNAVNWLFLANHLLKYGKIEGNGLEVKTMISQSLN